MPGSATLSLLECEMNKRGTLRSHRVPPGKNMADAAAMVACPLAGWKARSKGAAVTKGARPPDFRISSQDYFLCSRYLKHMPIFWRSRAIRSIYFYESERRLNPSPGGRDDLVEESPIPFRNTPPGEPSRPPLPFRPLAGGRTASALDLGRNGRGMVFREKAFIVTARSTGAAANHADNRKAAGHCFNEHVAKGLPPSQDAGIHRRSDRGRASCRRAMSGA